MPSRRVVALAQALTLILLLGPGLPAGIPGTVKAAVRQADPEIATIFDATGKGIGCQVGKRTFRGPRKPSDPPWPPGTRPTTTPEPTPDVTSVVPEASDAPASPDDVAPEEPAAADPAEEPSAEGRTQLLVGSGVRVAQAEPSAEPTEDRGAQSDPAAQPDPAAEPDPATVPDSAAETDPGGTDDGDVDLEPDVDTAPETTRQGRSGLVAGIDVSRHQETIDYDQVTKAGKRFVLIKATENHAWIDPWFSTNVSRARAAGLAVGAYHVFDYTFDGTAQADHFVDLAEAHGGINDALAPFVDVECWSYRGSSTHVLAQGRLRDFVKRVYARTGRLPVLYTSAHMWNQVVGNAEGFENLPLWAACWGCDSPPALPPGWDEWAFWQWRPGSSRAQGINRFDRNYFNGSRDELEALQLRPFAIEGGAQVTGREGVELDLGGRDATHYRTSPDGETWTCWTRIRSAPEVELSPEEGRQAVFVQLRFSPELVSPVLSDSITLDRSGPVLSQPVVVLRLGAVGEALGGEAPTDETPAGIPVSVSWTAVDAHAGLSDASVSIACGDARTERIEAPGSAPPGELVTWDATAAVAPETSCDITAIGHDGVGNTSRRTLEGVAAAVVPATDGAGDVPSATVSGTQWGVIARPGPDGGRATITLDGDEVGLVDLYSPQAGDPEVVFVADLGPGIDQEVRVEATGTADPASSGARVEVDGFVVLGSAEAPTPTAAAAPSDDPAPSEAATRTGVPEASDPSAAPASTDLALDAEDPVVETDDPAAEGDAP